MPTILFPRAINRTSGENNRPVFITGAPRCGSSWVGEILGACTDVRYVYEPFNHRWMPALRGHLPHFTYINDKSEIPPVIQKTAENAFSGLQSSKQLARAIYRRYWVAATRKASRVMVKDPTASLMSAWIAKQFETQILFVIRHPCGFASSLDALDWKLGVNSLLRQNHLMQDHLEGFREVLNRARNDKWLSRGAVWGAIHKVFTRQLECWPDWRLLKYEDLCDDPVSQFETLTEEFGLKLNLRSRQKIAALSATDSTDSGSTRRNSRMMPDIWRQRMSPGEIDAVMGIVAEFGLGYYM